MKWIGQHIVDLIARFRGAVYLERVSTGTIASGGNLGLDSNNRIVKANEATGDITGVTITTDSGGGNAASATSGSADFSILGNHGVGVTNSDEIINITAIEGEIDHDSLLNFASNEHFTMADIESIGTDGDTLAILASDVNLSSETSLKPIIKLSNTTNDALCSLLNFTKLRDDNGVASGTLLGAISFNGEDSGQNPEEYAFIRSEIDVSTATEESGKLILGVANHDGGGGDGLILTGRDNDDEIHATVGLGANSVVTVPGQLLAVNGGMGTRHYGSTIKILPSDWVQNEGGGVNKSHQFDSTGTIGIRATSTDAELWAFVSIPEGMKATHTHIKGLDSGTDGSSADDIVMNIYSYSLDDGSLSQPASGTDANAGVGVVGTNCNHADVNSTAINCLAVKVTIDDIAGADTDVVYGGYVTIAAI